MEGRLENTVNLHRSLWAKAKTLPPPAMKFRTFGVLSGTAVARDLTTLAVSCVGVLMLVRDTWCWNVPPRKLFEIFLSLLLFLFFPPLHSVLVCLPELTHGSPSNGLTSLQMVPPVHLSSPEFLCHRGQLLLAMRQEASILTSSLVSHRGMSTTSREQRRTLYYRRFGRPTNVCCTWIIQVL